MGEDYLMNINRGFMKKSPILVFAVFASLIVISCSKPDPLIGTWKNSILGLESSFTFNADKTFSASAFGKDIKGTWSRDSKGLKLVNSDGETNEMSLLQSENQFTMTSEGQSTGIVFNRTPPMATSKTKAPDTMSPTSAPAPTPAATETPKDTIPWIKEGMFKVGTDLPADEYLICAKEGESGYYQLTKDSSGELGSIISNDNFDSDRYLTVSNGQYLTVTGALLCSSKTLTLSPVDEKWNPGMYKVGRRY